MTNVAHAQSHVCKQYIHLGQSQIMADNMLADAFHLLEFETMNNNSWMW